MKRKKKKVTKTRLRESRIADNVPYTTKKSEREKYRLKHTFLKVSVFIFRCMPADDSTKLSAGGSPRSPRADGTEEKKLTAEELEQVIQRLYYQQQTKTKQWEDKRMDTLSKTRPPPKTISKEELETLVQRVYNQQIERKNKTKETLQMKQDALIPAGKSISEAELQEMIQRMFYMENEKKVKTQQTLVNKYQPQQESKKLDAEQVKASALRLSHVDWEKRERELMEKHVLPHDPKTVKMTREQLNETATRLSTKK